MKYVITGYGRFGKIAFARLRSAFTDASFVLIDPKGFEGADFDAATVTAIQADAVSVLHNRLRLDDTDMIVPMVPFHLAAEYVLALRPSARGTMFPRSAAALAPNPFALNESTLACSRADFLCPDDCPEGDLCTVTGQPRDEPLYAFLGKLVVPGFDVHVQRSYQLLPGVGGYPLGQLRELAQRIRPGACLIVTACKCHGIFTAIEVRERA